LIVSRGAGEIVDVEVFEDLSLLNCWEKSPADSTSRPGKTFRRSTYQDCFLFHPGVGDDAVMLGPIEEDMFVNLIGEDADIIGAFLPNHLSDLLQLTFGSHPSCGVGWKVKKDHLRFFVKQGGQFLTREAEVLFFLQMKWNGFSPDIIDERFVNRKSGTGVNDLISWIAVSLLTKANGRLGTWEDDNALRSRLNPTCLAQLFCYGFAKRQYPLRIAIMGVVEVNLSLDLVLNVLGHGKIGLPEIAFDNLLPLVFEGPDLGSDLKGTFCID
jgi:hypothetical protein